MRVAKTKTRRFPVAYQSPEATEPHVAGSGRWKLEAPTLPPGGRLFPRDPAFIENQWLEITHENRLLVIQ